MRFDHVMYYRLSHCELRGLTWTRERINYSTTVQWKWELTARQSSGSTRLGDWWARGTLIRVITQHDTVDWRVGSQSVFNLSLRLTISIHLSCDMVLSGMSQLVVVSMRCWCLSAGHDRFGARFIRWWHGAHVYRSQKPLALLWWRYGRKAVSTVSMMQLAAMLYSVRNTMKSRHQPLFGISNIICTSVR